MLVQTYDPYFVEFFGCDIAGLLNISDQIGSFDDINTAQVTIEQAIQNFTQILEPKAMLNYFIQDFMNENRTFISDNYYG